MLRLATALALVAAATAKSTAGKKTWNLAAPIEKSPFRMATLLQGMQKDGVAQPQPVCADSLPQVLESITDGEFADCAEAVGALIAAGATCQTDLGNFDPELKGKTAAGICCKTCAANSGGGGNDPFVKECSAVEQICIQDLMEMSSDTGTGACDKACDNAQGAAGMNLCVQCVQEIFGAEYKPCSCCIVPIIKKYGGEIEKDDIAMLKYLFPCAGN